MIFRTKGCVPCRAQQVRIPGPAGPHPNVNGHSQGRHMQFSVESGSYDWKPGDSDAIDRSLDGPRGLSLLDSSFEEPTRPAAEKEKSRRQSNISLESASTDHDHAAMRDAQSPEARGALYLRSWLFPVRRVLTAYYFLTSLVFIFCFTTKVRCHSRVWVLPFPACC